MSIRPEIQEIKNIQELENFKSEWNEFLESIEFPAPFLLYENYYSWWKNFGHESSPLILVLRSKGEILCILPLIQYSIQLFGHSFKILKGMRNDHSFTYDISLKDNIENSISAINHYLQRKGIALIDFGHLPDDSPFFKSLRDSGMLRKKMFLFEGETNFGCPFIDIQGTWEHYWNTLSSKLRQNLRRTEKSLSATGNITICEAHSPDMIKESLTESFRIESLSWKSERGSTIVSDDNLKNFYMDFCELLSERGLLHLYFLVVNNKKIAFDLSMQFRGVMYGMKTGYDSEYSKYSPGLLLRKKILEKLFSEHKVYKYDLMGLVDDWKQKWTQKKVVFKRLIIFRKGLFSLLRAFNAGYVKIFIKYLLHRFTPLRTILRYYKYTL